MVDKALVSFVNHLDKFFLLFFIKFTNLFTFLHHIGVEKNKFLTKTKKT